MFCIYGNEIFKILAWSRDSHLIVLLASVLRGNIFFFNFSVRKSPGAVV